MLGFLFGVYMSEKTNIQDSGDGLGKKRREGYGFIYCGDIIVFLGLKLRMC